MHLSYYYKLQFHTYLNFIFYFSVSSFMLAFKNQKPTVPCSTLSDEGTAQVQWRLDLPAEIQVCAL